MADQLEVGVTGAGGLGTHLAQMVQEADDARVAAVTDVAEENRNRLADEHDVPDERRFEDHETMLDEVDLDGVTIATPHTLHYEQTVAALDREIDTLCEKPLCTDLDHARDLVRRSDEADASLMVGYQRHLGEAFRHAREQLEAKVGEPQYVTADVTQNWIEAQRGAWRTNPDLSGGGQLYDTGSHLVDVVLWTTGLTPTSVNAQMLFDDDEQRVDKQAVVDVTFENGAVASIGVSGDAPCVREHLRVWGPEGAFSITGKNWEPRELAFIDPEGGEEVPEIESAARTNKVEAFLDVIRDGIEPPATPRDAMKVTALTEAAYESARTGERVDIDL